MEIHLNFFRLDLWQEVQCDTCKKHFNCDSGDAITIRQNGITIFFCSNACMMDVCAFCNDPKLKANMFEIHNVHDDIEMVCSLKCLTLFDETNSAKCDDLVVASSNVLSAVTNIVSDPPIEHVSRSVPMTALVSTLQPLLIICVEILHDILIHKRIATNSKDEQSSDATAVALVSLQATNVVADTATVSTEVVENRVKRLFEDVDQGDSQLHEDSAKRVKEDENANESNEMFLNINKNDTDDFEASLNDEDLLELSPSQMLQLFIDSEIVSISWNLDTVLANDSSESNNCDDQCDKIDAKTEVECTTDN